MTFNDIVDEVRSQISDETSVRWSDTVLRTYAFSGEIEIVGKHPEAQFENRVLASTPVLLTANTQSFTIDASWRTPLIDFVCSKVLSEDDEDQHNAALAKKFFAAFTAAMKGEA